MRTIRRGLLVLMIVLGTVLGVAAPASANHIGPFVQNSDTTVASHQVYCYADTGEPYTQVVSSGGFSQRDCRYLYVPNYYRMLYKSLNTGALYWTVCGEDVTNRSGAGGWWYLGGVSVQVTKTAGYPQAPAQTCTG